MPGTSALQNQPHRAADAALAAMRLAVALAAVIVFSSFEASGIGEGPMALRSLLVAAFCYGVAGLAFWLLIAMRRVEAERLRYPMLVADALFVAAVLTWEGEHGIIIYAPALLAIQSARDRFGLRFGRMAALAMSLAFAASVRSAPEWSGHPLALTALVAGFWMLVAPGYGRLTRNPGAIRVAPAPEPQVVRPEKVVPALPAAFPVPAVRRGRILVAQGDRTGRVLLVKCLERAGYDVTAVANSDSVMNALDEAASGRPFEALIADLDLPGTGGAALTQFIRATRFEAADLVIIGLDGSAEPAPASHWRELGMNDCLRRPVHPGRLLECLRLLLPDVRPEPEAGPVLTPVLEDVPAEKIVEALDLRALRDLESLGGRDFVRDIANQFVADGAIALRSLAHSMQKGDAALFRDQAHALRSSAANVGARGIYATCLAWREIESEDLASNGQAYLKDLHDQFEEATRFLLQYLDGPVGNSSQPAGSQERAA
jgi:CheY-like chemotaxis protein